LSPRRRRYVALVATAAAAVLLVSCSSSKKSGGDTSSTAGTSPAASSGGSSSAASQYPAIPAGTIHLCGSYPVSGANAAFGSSAKATAVIQQDIINNEFGGIDGHKVQVDIADDKSSATEAVNIATKYASDHASDPLKCPVVYQISQNPTTAPLQAAILNKAKIAMVASQSPDEFFNAAKYPSFFSISPSDAQLGEVAAHYLIANKLNKIGVLTNAIPQEAEYIKDLMDSAKAQGGDLQIVKTVQLGIGAVDAKTQLTELKSANPDVVLVATEFGFGPIWQSFQSIGWSPKIMGDVGFFYDGYNSLKGLAAGAAAPCWWGQDKKNTALPQPVIDAINKIAPLNGGFAPDPIIAANVGVGQMLLAKYAIEKYHSVDADAIGKALSSMTDTSLPNWWDGAKFTYSGDQRKGLVGDFGAGICSGEPLGTVGNNFKTFVYADDYRAKG
jgi:branched-chain amino acid transport system substrate-binding protein